MRLNVVTGVPLVLSHTPSFPSPCGHLLFTCVQFFQRGGIRSLAATATYKPRERLLWRQMTAAMTRNSESFADFGALSLPQSAGRSLSGDCGARSPEHLT